MNIAITEFPPAAEASGGHKHGEAYIYWLSGKGYSIVGDERVEWGAGDAMYVPPDTFHQHFNTGDQPARYLRLIPTPLLLSLLPLFASLSQFLTIEDDGPAT
jgi:gentisate 1,2-dioxygenase